jgi:hypothetical protein
MVPPADGRAWERRLPGLTHGGGLKAAALTLAPRLVAQVMAEAPAVGVEEAADARVSSIPVIVGARVKARAVARAVWR